MPGGINSTQATAVKDGGTKTKLHSESLSAQAVDDALLELLQEPNPITESASLYALTQLNRSKGIAQAQKILQQPLQNDLVKDTAASILGQSSRTPIIEQLLSMSGQPDFQNMTPDRLLALVTQAQQNHFRYYRNCAPKQIDKTTKITDRENLKCLKLLSLIRENPRKPNQF